MNAKEPQPNWSRAYWTLLVNQVFVIGLVSLLAGGMLRESWQACYAAELEMPTITLWYFDVVGWMGLLWAGCISLAISVAVIGLRRRIASVLVASVSFAGCIVFLAGSIFASSAPLLMAIRYMLPPVSPK